MAADFASEGLAMLSPPITTIQADVTSDDDVQRVVSIVLERHGRIEVLVNNTALSVLPWPVLDFLGHPDGSV